VGAYDGSGNVGTSNVASATTQGVTLPPAPTGLHGTASNGLGTFTLSWNAVSGATSYKIFDTTTPPATQAYAGAATSVGLSRPKGFIYKFYATACNANGCGPASATINVTVDCNPSCL
jgi:hypothetical protein